MCYSRWRGGWICQIAPKGELNQKKGPTTSTDDEKQEFSPVRVKCEVKPAKINDRLSSLILIYLLGLICLEYVWWCWAQIETDWADLSRGCIFWPWLAIASWPPVCTANRGGCPLPTVTTKTTKTIIMMRMVECQSVTDLKRNELAKLGRWHRTGTGTGVQASGESWIGCDQNFFVSLPKHHCTV